MSSNSLVECCLSGRVAVAQAALEFRRGLFERTRRYTDNKVCWSPSGSPTLSEIPQLKALFADADARIAPVEAFVTRCQQDLCTALRANKPPGIDLVEAIAVCKVKAVEESIQLCHRLKNDVGSYALMAGTGFENSDFLVCCKFAEGDSRVLMQKMSRDRLKVGTLGTTLHCTAASVVVAGSGRCILCVNDACLCVPVCRRSSQLGNCLRPTHRVTSCECWSRCPWH